MSIFTERLKKMKELARAEQALREQGMTSLSVEEAWVRLEKLIDRAVTLGELKDEGCYYSLREKDKPLQECRYAKHGMPQALREKIDMALAQPKGSCYHCGRPIRRNEAIWNDWLDEGGGRICPTAQPLGRTCHRPATKKESRPFSRAFGPADLGREIPPYNPALCPPDPIDATAVSLRAELETETKKRIMAQQQVKGLGIQVRNLGEEVEHLRKSRDRGHGERDELELALETARTDLETLQASHEQAVARADKSDQAVQESIEKFKKLGEALEERDAQLKNLLAARQVVNCCGCLGHIPTSQVACADCQGQTTARNWQSVMAGAIQATLVILFLFLAYWGLSCL